jgi:hypothetical protein
MLIHINPTRNDVQVIDGAAHIVLSIDAAGNASLRSFIAGQHDATYAPLPDDRLLKIEVPKLLAELRLRFETAGNPAPVSIAA